MKLLEKDFAVNRMGTAKIVPEEPDDLWLLYNIISPGDYVTADTTRKVHVASSSATTKKSATATRVKLSLNLKVTCRDFEKDSSTLRVHGRNLDANQHVAAGSFHTLTLETNKPFELRKKLWNDDAVEALREGTENNAAAAACADGGELAVVMFHEQHAEIYLLAKGVTAMVSKIERIEPSSSPRASRAGRKGSSGHHVYFREVFGEFVKRVDLNKAKSVVIASANSTKDEFRRFMISESKRVKMKSLESCTGKIVVTGLGCKGDLSEVLGESAVISLIKDSKIGVEIRALRELWDMITSNSDRACYGPKNVESAMEMNAIETLLITDELYRSAEVGTRKRYGGLVRSVKEAGGKALVYSCVHVMAQQLANLTGVAAILRFPLPDLEDMDVV